MSWCFCIRRRSQGYFERGTILSFRGTQKGEPLILKPANGWGSISGHQLADRKAGYLSSANRNHEAGKPRQPQTLSVENSDWSLSGLATSFRLETALWRAVQPVAGLRVQELTVGSLPVADVTSPARLLQMVNYACLTSLGDDQDLKPIMAQRQVCGLPPGPL